jgi:hypothetical protein
MSLPGVNLDALESRPIDQWGVVGYAPHFGGVFSSVWDMAEINGVIYVGGGFTGVQKGFGQPVQPQRFLAAFDRDSGEWITTFRPTFDKPVLALQVSTSGKLLVGGEFTVVNGEARKGLVAIDPVSGEIDPTFRAAVDGARPIVRELMRDGSTLYIGGIFSRVTGSASQPWIWNAARVDDTTGRLDATWTPRFMGGVWDLTIDTRRDRVVAVGSFTSVEMQPGTSDLGSVSRTTGAVVTGLAPYVYNMSSQRQTVGVTYAGDRLYVVGEQHSVQVLDPQNHNRLGWMNTGYPTCTTFSTGGCQITAGGAYQVVERTADGKVFTGCHCFEHYVGNRANWSIGTYYNSFDNVRRNLYAVQALDAVTSKIASDFVPGLRKAPAMETWNIFVDSRGCYYVGGYFVAKRDGSWLGGFGRMCEPVKAVTGLTAGVGPGTVTLSWTAADQQLPVRGHVVTRNGVALTTAAGDATSITLTGQRAGQATYAVAVRDASGRLSPIATVAVTVPASPDEIVKLTPTGATQSSSIAAFTGPAVGIDGVKRGDYPFVVHTADNVGTDWWQADLGAVRYLDRVEIWNRTDCCASRMMDQYLFVSETPFTTSDAARLATDPTVTTIRITQSSAQFAVPVRTSGRYVRLAASGLPGASEVLHFGEMEFWGRMTPAPPVVDNQAPEAPAGVVATPNGSTVTVTWQAARDLPDPGGVGVAAYFVVRDWNRQWRVPAGAVLSFTDTDVPNGRRRYQVFAVDAGGRISTGSTPVTVTVGTPDTEAPEAPASVQATLVDGRSVQVTWTAARDRPLVGGSGVVGYWVVRNWTTQFFVSANGPMSFVDTTAPAGRHRYEVHAVDAGNLISRASTPAVFVTVP